MQSVWMQSIMPTYSCAGELNYLYLLTQLARTIKNRLVAGCKTVARNFARWGELTSPSPSSPPVSPFPSLPSSLPQSPNSARGLGERCKLSQRRPGRPQTHFDSFKTIRMYLVATSFPTFWEFEPTKPALNTGTVALWQRMNVKTARFFPGCKLRRTVGLRMRSVHPLRGIPRIALHIML